MPDPLRQTISATEAPALFNVSPWCTRWMLYHRFAEGINIDSDEDGRMSEGKRMEPLILSRSEHELALHVAPNTEQFYLRRGRLGCTRDAEILHPEKGPGALEIKCVFDYQQWMSRWNGGDNPPREYEIQLQTQMFVGDGSTPFEWGVIAAWVGGDQRYFEREPNRTLWAQLEAESLLFFEDVELGREPDPFGSPVELPWLQQIYPTKEGKTLDLSSASGAERYLRKGRQYLSSKALARNHTNVADALRAEFYGLARDADVVLLPGGARLSGFGKGKRLRVIVPDATEGDDE